MVTADALYFMDYLDPNIRPISVVDAVKLACLAEIGGQIEYAFEICRQAATLIAASEPEAAHRLKAGSLLAAKNYRHHSNLKA